MRITLALVMIAIITAIVTLITSFFKMNWLIEIPAIIVITTMIFFFGFFKYFVIIVPENMAWVMADRLKNEKYPVTDTFTGYREIRAQKEFQAGLHFIFPWEEKAKEVNMTRVIPVEGNPEETYTLKDGKAVVKLKFLVSVVPLQGYIVNFVRHDEKDTIKKVTARAMAYLQGEIGKWDKVSFDSSAMEALKKGFEEIYGGPEKVEEEEKVLGIWTGTPRVFDISLPREVEQAVNEAQIMDQVMKRAMKLVTKSKKTGKPLSLGEAMKWASVAQGKVAMGLLEGTGLLGFGGTSKKKSNKKGGSEDED